MSDKSKEVPDVLTLENIKGGAAVEMFDFELNRVLENIDDPNFRAKGKRRIVLAFDFHVDEDREIKGVDIGSSAVLTGKKPVSTEVFMGRRHGALVAVEYDPRQSDLFDPDRGADVTPIDRNTKEQSG